MQKNKLPKLDRHSMGTTHDIKYAKIWYPKGKFDEESGYKTYLAPNINPWDPRIAERYGEEEREDNDRINKGDLKKKNKQTLVEEFGGQIYHNFSWGKSRKKKVSSAEKMIQNTETSLQPGEAYECRIIRIDDFGNATISVKGTNIQGMIYKARKMWLAVWMKKDVLFARINRKGRFVFEMPKNPGKLLSDYYDTYANWLSQEETIKKLFPLYGSKKVKEVLTSVVDEKTLEKLLDERKNAA